MYNIVYKSFDVGTAEFRRQATDPKLRDLLREHPIVAVGRYADEPAAVVISPATFAELQESQERLEELRAMLPLLLAALAAGATLPSETLRRLGTDLTDDSWQTLNELQHRFPVRIGYSEDGHRLPRGRLESTGPVFELDDELVVIDD